jgi:hypothetical protein
MQEIIAESYQAIKNGAELAESPAPLENVFITN